MIIMENVQSVLISIKYIVGIHHQVHILIKLQRSIRQYIIVHMKVVVERVMEQPRIMLGLIRHVQLQILVINADIAKEV